MTSSGGRWSASEARSDRALRTQGFEVEGWRVEPLRNRVVPPPEDAAPAPRHLEPKAMDVLVALAGHAPQPIPRDDLLESVWPGVIVTDDVLTNAVWQLRRVFGDQARSPRFIETIRGRGYRLVAAVHVLPRPEAESSDREAEATDEATDAEGPAPNRAATTTVNGARAALILALLVAALVAWNRTRPSAPTTDARTTVASRPDGVAAARDAVIRDGDWAAAEAALRRAIDEAPEDPRAAERLAWLLVLRGRAEEAEMAIDQARARAPRDPLVAAAEARIAFFAGRPDRTVESARAALRLDPRCRPARHWLALGLAAQGTHGAAEDALRQLAPRPSSVGDLAHAWASIGRRLEAERLLRSSASRDASHYQRALAHLALDEIDLSLGVLELAFATKDPQRHQLAVDPRFLDLRDEPRVRALIESLWDDAPG